jgi:D-psicose/D-tagatose/L-ribulose 3-epimerase
MPRKFAASAWIWHADPSVNGYEAIIKAFEIGYDGIEIPTFDGRLNTMELRNKFASTSSNFKPILIGGCLNNTDISSEDQSIRDNGVEYIKACINICHEIGGSLVCGPLHSAVGKKTLLTEVERAKLYSKIAKIYKQEISKFAKDRSVRIALEPLCRYDTSLLNTTAQGISLIDQISEENIGLLLDTFHLNIEEQSMQDAIEQAGDRLFHFHACENDRGTPGKGHLDWRSISAALDRIKYDRWLALESFTPFEGGFSSAMNVWRKLADSQDELASEGLQFLKSIFS